MEDTCSTKSEPNLNWYLWALLGIFLILFVFTCIMNDYNKHAGKKFASEEAMHEEIDGVWESYKSSYLIGIDKNTVTYYSKDTGKPVKEEPIDELNYQKGKVNGYTLLTDGKLEGEDGIVYNHYSQSSKFKYLGKKTNEEYVSSYYKEMHSHSDSDANTARGYAGGEISASTSLGEENALKSAKAYIEYTAFSREGLIKQLKYEGYTESEARYGVDNCGANWKEQAVRMAKQYLNYSSFSRSGLIE